MHGVTILEQNGLAIIYIQILYWNSGNSISRVGHMKIQSHVVDIRTTFFDSIWPYESDDTFEKSIPVILTIFCIGGVRILYLVLGSDILEYYKKILKEIRKMRHPLYFGRFCMCMCMKRFLFDFRISRTLFFVYYFFEYFF